MVFGSMERLESEDTNWKDRRPKDESWLAYKKIVDELSGRPKSQNSWSAEDYCVDLTRRGQMYRPCTDKETEREGKGMMERGAGITKPDNLRVAGTVLFIVETSSTIL